MGKLPEIPKCSTKLKLIRMLKLGSSPNSSIASPTNALALNKTPLSVKQMPLAQRPREKLLKNGASALSDAELLAIFLRTGLPNMNVIELATKLLRDFASLRALFAATEAEFCAHKGLGVAKYVQLQAVIEMTKRYLSEGVQRGEALLSPEDTKLYLIQLLREQKREMFYVLLLDNQHRVITEKILFKGTIDSAHIHPREVVRFALTHNAAALIMAHNHPSGVAKASEADYQITRRLVKALALIDIRVLDHFIVADGEVLSFAEKGWM